MKPYMAKKHDTICWECKKNGGMCSWSRSFTPVEGWIATPTVLQGGYGAKNPIINSFDVYSCPEFIKAR